MTGSRELVERAERAIAASSRTSTTPPGQTEQGTGRSGRPAPERVEAINQVFALFRLNYHNQYYAAFPDAEQLRQIKKLWLESLGDYGVSQLLAGAKRAIESSEYLPTLHRMHCCCREAATDLGLPPARAAYEEACAAPVPRAAQRWSHPAVYLAGRDSGWFFLANQPEAASWPVFRDHYERYCSRVLAGETLEMPAAPALEQQQGTPLSDKEQLARLRQLRQELDL
ncbi:MAG: replication protein P [Pseudohaliea sp.]